MAYSWGIFRLFLVNVLTGCNVNFLANYDYAWINGMSFEFKEWLNETCSTAMTQLELNDIWSNQASIIFYAELFGAVLGALLADYIGRRGAIAASYATITCGNALILCAPKIGCYPILFVSRLFSGLGFAACFAVMPVFLAEVSHPKYLAILGLMQQIALDIGNICGLFLPPFLNNLRSVHNYALFWHFLLPTLMGIVGICTALKIPESSRYLYFVKNESEKAQESVTFFATFCGDETGQNLLPQEWEDKSMRAKFKGKLSLKNFWARRNKNALLISLFICLIGAFCGRVVMQMYTVDLLREGGFSVETARTITIIYSAGTVVVSSFGTGLMLKLKRRPVLLVGITLTLLAMLMTLLCLWGTATLTSSSLKLAAKIGLSIAVGAIVLSGLMFILTSLFCLAELFDQSGRSLGYGLVYAVYAGLLAPTTRIYGSLMNYGHIYAVLFLTLSLLAAAIPGIILLPETHGCTPEHLENKLRTVKCQVNQSKLKKREAEECAMLNTDDVIVA